MQRRETTSGDERRVESYGEEAHEALLSCFEITEWPAFCEPHEVDIDGLTECITDYINFCVDCNVPARTVTCYANNKPWITKDIKVIVNEKKRAFRDGNRDEVRRVQGVLKLNIREAKDNYRRKLENKLRQNNMRDVWSGMRTITRFQKTGSIGLEGRVDWANELNLFFNRFDNLAPLPLLLAAQQQLPLYLLLLTDPLSAPHHLNLHPPTPPLPPALHHVLHNLRTSPLPQLSPLQCTLCLTW